MALFELSLYTHTFAHKIEVPQTYLRNTVESLSLPDFGSISFALYTIYYILNTTYRYHLQRYFLKRWLTGIEPNFIVHCELSSHVLKAHTIFHSSNVDLRCPRNNNTLLHAFFR